MKNNSGAASAPRNGPRLDRTLKGLGPGEKGASAPVSSGAAWTVTGHLSEQAWRTTAPLSGWPDPLILPVSRHARSRAAPPPLPAAHQGSLLKTLAATQLAATLKVDEAPKRSTVPKAENGDRGPPLNSSPLVLLLSVALTWLFLLAAADGAVWLYLRERKSAHAIAANIEVPHTPSGSAVNLGRAYDKAVENERAEPPPAAHSGRAPAADSSEPLQKGATLGCALRVQADAVERRAQVPATAARKKSFPPATKPAAPVASPVQQHAPVAPALVPDPVAPAPPLRRYPLAQESSKKLRGF